MIASSTAAAGGLSAGLGIVWIVVLFGIMYFMMIRPQKKEQKRTQTMLNSMEVGDSVVTTSGFYGVVIDMTEEDVIVEPLRQRTFEKQRRFPPPKYQLPSCRSRASQHPLPRLTFGSVRVIKGRLRRCAVSLRLDVRLCC